MDNIPFTKKYRPTKLADIVGQDVVVQILTNSFKQKRMHHAYILEGLFGSGKCIIGNSLILTNDGLKKISDIVPDKSGISNIDIDVVQGNGDKGKSKFGYHEKQVNTIALTTNEGYSIEGTPEHPILIMDEKGQLSWRKLSDIQEDDYVAIFRKDMDEFENSNEIKTVDFNSTSYLNKFGNNDKFVKCKICNKKYGNLNNHLKLHDITIAEYKKRYSVDYITAPFYIKQNSKNRINFSLKIPETINCDIARLFGYMVAEGHCHVDDKSNIFQYSFSNTEMFLLNDVKKILKSNFNYIVNFIKDKRNNVCNINISTIIIKDFLDKHIGKSKSGEKDVPNSIISSPMYIIKEFLKAYFEGDGYVQKNGRSVGCCSKSYSLLKNIQLLLLRFGIISSLKIKKIKKLSFVDKGYVSWILTIQSFQDILLYYKKIGFISKRKSKELKDIVIHKRKSLNPNKDIVPFIKEYLYNIKKSIPIKKSGHIEMPCGQNLTSSCYPPNSCNNSNNKDISYNSLKNIKKYFIDLYEILNNNNYFSNNNANIIKSNIQEAINYCTNLLDVNYFYSKVVLKKKGIADVYDICKSNDDKSFIANGFVNHNTSTARIMAAMQNCEKGPTLEPCGECDNCKAIFTGKSLDVKEVDAASNRGIDDIRDIQKEIGFCPLDSRKKFVIIDEAHSLSGYAAEAALKMIEEPPANVVFVLCTTSPQQLKQTIHSRCISLTFRRIGWMELATHLKKIASLEQIDYDDDAIQMIAKMSEGSARSALRNLQTLINYCGDKKITVQECQKILGVIDETLFFDLIDNIVNLKAPLCMHVINTLVSQGKNAKEIIKGLELHIRNLIVCRVCNEASSLYGLSEDEAKKYLHQSEIASPPFASQMWGLIKKSKEEILLNMDTETSLINFAVQSIIIKKKMDFAKKKNL